MERISENSSSLCLLVLSCHQVRHDLQNVSVLTILHIYIYFCYTILRNIPLLGFQHIPKTIDLYRGLY